MNFSTSPEVFFGTSNAGRFFRGVLFAVISLIHCGQPDCQWGRNGKDCGTGGYLADITGILPSQREFQGNEKEHQYGRPIEPRVLDWIISWMTMDESFRTELGGLRMSDPCFSNEPHCHELGEAHLAVTFGHGRIDDAIPQRRGRELGAFFLGQLIK